MKRLSILLSAVVILAIAATGIASASGGQATLTLRKTSLGKILVTGRGLTLYMFAADRRNKDNCLARTATNCARIWPLFTTSGKPVARGGVKRSLIGTITLPNGQTQVTYAGHPLYRYVADRTPGEVFGQGVLQSGAKWYVLNAAGHVIKK